jgi:pimeloyl-ACP methyl ester carboxylesterase
MSVACSSSGATSTARPADPTALATGTLPPARTSSVPAGWATPRTLPVTPVAQTYKIDDPKFDALAGARAIYGTNNGASYEIEVPDAWNGSVVYFAHGFRGNVPDLKVDPPPLRDYLIAHGYAWAASSYSLNGYNPGAGARDTYALRSVFEQKVGTPKRSYIYGQSMGGNVVSVSLEMYPTAYDGALSECGALVGQDIVDYFLSWGALAGYFTGTNLTDITTDAGKLGSVLRNKVGPDLGTADNLTEKGKEFASAIEYLTGGPRPYFKEGFGANYIFNFLVLVNAVGVPGASNAVAQNADTHYAVADGLGISTDQLNREIPRVQANPAYQDAQRYPEFAPLSGKLQRPLLTLHGTGDLYVPISLEQHYRRIVDEAGAGNMLVQRAVRRPGHCTFTPEERQRAFEDLVAWVEHGTKPAGDDLSGDLRDVGRAFTQPLAQDDPGGLTP